MKYIWMTIFSLLIGCQTITLDSLRGLTKAEVKEHLGEPVGIMKESNREIWTYRQGKCTKYVFFDMTEVVKYVDMNGVCLK